METIPLPDTVRAGERRRLMAATGLNLAAAAAEFAGAWITGSLALLGDAIHMVTHLLSLTLSYGAILLALRPSSPSQTFRLWRAEILASFVNGLALIPVAVYVLYESWIRWHHPVEIRAGPMLGVAAAGLAVNLMSAAILRRHAADDLNIRGAFLHMLADSASSLGVMAAGIAVAATGWRQADPLAAALISGLILIWCVSLLRDSGRILLESAPRHMRVEEVRRAMKNVPGVREIHDLHIWTITSRLHALTAHVLLEEDLKTSEAQQLAGRLRDLLGERFDIHHATLQLEVEASPGTPCRHEHAPRGSGDGEGS